MLQVLVLGVAIGLIILGIKGFTVAGIPLTKTTALTGTSGKIAGVICILAGILFIPLFLLVILGYTTLLSN